MSVQAIQDEVHWTIPPQNGVKGLKIPFIGYRYMEKFHPSITSDDEIAILFKEIFASGNVSDIYIASDQPILVQLKGQGIKSATPEILDGTQARTLVEKILKDNTCFTNIAGREVVGGAIAIAIEQQVASNITTYGFNEAGVRQEMVLDTNLVSDKQLTSFRWNLSGCISKTSRDGFVFVMRPLTDEPTEYKKLGIEMDFIKGYLHTDGICLMAGSTGQGKSTTLSSIIRYILEHHTIIRGTIVTIEDPIEIQYSKINSEHSVVFQKQVGYGGHLKDFNVGVHSALREAPSLILVGELRNSESVRTALEASLTGHTVYATVHANNVGAILPRLISQVEKDEVGRILDSLRILSAQKLITLTTGKRTTVREWLVFTPALRNALSEFIDEPLVLGNKIRAIVDQGLYGSVSFKTQAEKLKKDGLIDEENYERLCVDETLSPEELAQLADL